MANGLALNTSTVVGGLGTQTFTVTVAGLYTVDVKFFIPYNPAGSSSSSTAAALSALSVVVNQDTGGGPVAKLTTPAPSANQPLVNGKVVLSCSVGDVITVVLTSANAADAALNAVKGFVNLFQGIGA